MDIKAYYKKSTLSEVEETNLGKKIKWFLSFQALLDIKDITIISGTPIKIREKGELKEVRDVNYDYVKKLYPIFVTVSEDNPEYDAQYEIFEKKVEDYKKVGIEMGKNQSQKLSDYIIKTYLTETQREVLFKLGQVDFSINTEESNFRLNMSFFDEGSVINTFTTIRKIAKKPYTLEEMNVSNEMLTHFKRQEGLILISGPTGSAKSSTLTSILDYYNKHEHKKIITLEDPIEFFWEKEKWDKSIILQREIGKEVPSFSLGLKSALRADPDIIVVGELRDKESIEMAIETAGTGILVIATVHIKSTIGVLDRLLGFFDGDKTKEIASKLSGTLNYVINQRLVATTEGYSVAYEYLDVQKGGIPNLIKDSNLKDIKEKMREIDSKGNKPHKTLSESLYELILKELISEQDVIEHYLNESVDMFKDNFDEYKIRFMKENNLKEEDINMIIESGNLFYKKKKERGLS